MDNQVVIVTGAGNGIGLSMVQQLLETPKVAHVVAVDIDIKQLEALQRSHAGRLHPLCGDVSKSSTNQEAVQEAVRHGGHINALILNAAIIKPVGSLPTLAIEDWRRTFDVNFFAVLYMIQYAWPHLVETQGSIIITSTRVCLKPSESWVCYASSKSLLNYLCSCIPLEDSRIKSIAVTPGAVDTDTNTAMRTAANLSPANKAFMKGLHDEGKLLKPELPASAFVKLVVEGIPPALTGQTVNWDVILAE